MPKNVNEKTDEIGSFSLVSRLTRDPTIKILMFTTTARYHLVTNIDFTKKYQKLAKILSKNLQNHGFLVQHPVDNGHVTGPQS